MAMVPLKSPKTGQPLDIRDVSPEVALLPMNAAMTVREIPCPHCGEGHMWTSSGFAIAINALRDSPDASRVLVDGGSATALP